MFKKMLAVVVIGFGFAAGAANAAENTPKIDKLFKKAAELRDEKNYAEAIKVLDEIIKLDPQNSFAWSEGAWIFNEQGKHDIAVQAAEKAIEINLDNSDAWREMGFALMRQKKHADAAKALASAIEKNRQNWFAYDYQAENYEKQGKFKLAQETRAAKAKEMAKAKKTDD